MRIICTSDTHDQHNELTLIVQKLVDNNQKNVLIHSGDISMSGNEKQLSEFITWFKELEGFDYKIFIAGNHDWCFEKKPKWLEKYINNDLILSNVFYLFDKEILIEDDTLSRPIKLYGSPWQPYFYNWAFNVFRESKLMYEIWDRIPLDTDILVTHGPPNGILDEVYKYHTGHRNVGCEVLRKKVDQLNFLINTFGHIHEGYGKLELNNKLYLNSSFCDIDYYPVNNPHVVDIKEKNNKIYTEYVKINPTNRGNIYT